jgi:hypothetical protein
MPHFSTKSIVVLVLTGTLTVAAVAQNKDRKQGPPPRPTNLRILPEDIEHDSLINTMRIYSASLGVKCGFCHAPSKEPGGHLDFASDEKREKATARRMMEMTAEINKEFFRPRRRRGRDDEDRGEQQASLRVTCYTCHHGHEEPEMLVMPKEERH